MAGTVTPDRVMAEVECVMSRPFAWGPCDCCTAACDVFLGLWGVDPMAALRGRYTGATGAARVLWQNGGLAAWAARVARREGLLPGHATGGFGLSVVQDRPSLLICIEPGLWAGKSLHGFALLRAAEMGWHHAQAAVDDNGPRGLHAGP